MLKTLFRDAHKVCVCKFKTQTQANLFFTATEKLGSEPSKSGTGHLPVQEHFVNASPVPTAYFSEN